METLTIPEGCILKGNLELVAHEGDIHIVSALVPARIHSKSGNILFQAKATMAHCEELRAENGSMQLEAASLSVGQLIAGSASIRAGECHFESVETSGPLLIQSDEMVIGQVKSGEATLNGDMVKVDSLHCEGTLTLRANLSMIREIRATKVIIHGSIDCKLMVASEGVFVESGNVSIKQLQSPIFRAHEDVTGIVAVATTEDVRAQGVRGFLHPDELAMLADTNSINAPKPNRPKQETSDPHAMDALYATEDTLRDDDEAEAEDEVILDPEPEDDEDFEQAGEPEVAAAPAAAEPTPWEPREWDVSESAETVDEHALAAQDSYDAAFETEVDSADAPIEAFDPEGNDPFETQDPAPSDLEEAEALDFTEALDAASKEPEAEEWPEDLPDTASAAIDIPASDPVTADLDPQDEDAWETPQFESSEPTDDLDPQDEDAWETPQFESSEPTDDLDAQVEDDAEAPQFESSDSTNAEFLDARQDENTEELPEELEGSPEFPTFEGIESLDEDAFGLPEEAALVAPEPEAVMAEPEEMADEWQVEAPVDSDSDDYQTREVNTAWEVSGFEPPEKPNEFDTVALDPQALQNLNAYNMNNLSSYDEVNPESFQTDDEEDAIEEVSFEPEQEAAEPAALEAPAEFDDELSFDPDFGEDLETEMEALSADGEGEDPEVAPNDGWDFATPPADLDAHDSLDDFETPIGEFENHLEPLTEEAFDDPFDAADGFDASAVKITDDSFNEPFKTADPMDEEDQDLPELGFEGEDAEDAIEMITDELTDDDLMEPLPDNDMFEEVTDEAADAGFQDLPTLPEDLFEDQFPLDEADLAGPPTFDSAELYSADLEEPLEVEEVAGSAWDSSDNEASDIDVIKTSELPDLAPLSNFPGDYTPGDLDSGDAEEMEDLAPEDLGDLSATFDPQNEDDDDDYLSSPSGENASYHDEDENEDPLDLPLGDEEIESGGVLVPFAEPEPEPEAQLDPEESAIQDLSAIMEQIRSYFPEDNYPQFINQIMRYLEERRLNLFFKETNKNAVLSSFDKFNHSEISNLARAFFQRVEVFRVESD